METAVVIGVVGLALCGLGILFIKRSRSNGGCSCGGRCGDCPTRKFTGESADITDAASGQKDGA